MPGKLWFKWDFPSVRLLTCITNSNASSSARSMVKFSAGWYQWCRNLLDTKLYNRSWLSVPELYIFGAVEVGVGSQAQLDEKACLWFFHDWRDHFLDSPDPRHPRSRAIRSLWKEDPAFGHRRYACAMDRRSPCSHWSLIAPAFWQLGPTGYILPVLLSGLIAERILCKRGVKDDKISFKVWKYLGCRNISASCL